MKQENNRDNNQNIFKNCNAAYVKDLSRGYNVNQHLISLPLIPVNCKDIFVFCTFIKLAILKS